MIPAGEVVLKIQFPDRESEHEAAALEHWNGDGAVRVVAHDPERHALLIERCLPGTHLRELELDLALDVMIELLPRLWNPARAPFRPLEEEAAWWIEAALAALEELGPTQGEQVLVHQDLHANNVLAAEREPWLAIDPKPLVGEREFGIAALVRAYELGHSRRVVLHRLDRLTAELGLDRERARGWALGQTLAWGYESPRHVETARWLLQAE